MRKQFQVELKGSWLKNDGVVWDGIVLKWRRKVFSWNFGKYIVNLIVAAHDKEFISKFEIFVAIIILS